MWINYSRQCSILTHSACLQLSDRRCWIVSGCRETDSVMSSFVFLCLASYESKCVETQGLIVLFFRSVSRNIHPTQRKMDGLRLHFGNSEVEGGCIFFFVISSISPALLAALLFQQGYQLSDPNTEIYWTRRYLICLCPWTLTVYGVQYLFCSGRHSGAVIISVAIHQEQALTLLSDCIYTDSILDFSLSARTCTLD